MQQSSTNVYFSFLGMVLYLTSVQWALLVTNTQTEFQILQ